MDFIEMYKSGLSIVQVSKLTGIHRSTVRYQLNKLGILRTPMEGIKLAQESGRLGLGNKGKKRVFTQEHKNNISKGRKNWAKNSAKGYSLKPSGYYEITMGENKFKSLHIVIMENHLGRKMRKGEHVHHINGVKTDNRIENLQVMSVSDHMAHHAKENYKHRKRDSKGRFI